MPVENCVVTARPKAPRVIQKVVQKEPRYVASISVSVMRFLRFGPVVADGMSLDISRSGMAILVCGPPQVGETVVIAPRVMTEPVDILATVRYSSPGRSGFQFFPLSPEARRKIDEWIRELESREEAIAAVWRNLRLR